MRVRLGRARRLEERVLKKALIGLAVVAFAIGCSNGGGGTTTGGGVTGGGVTGGGVTGGGTGLPAPTVNLGTSTNAKIQYLSGQGRRAVGSQFAILDIIRVQNGDADVAPVDQNTSTLNVQLDGYTINSFDFSVQVPAGTPSKTYTQFPLRVERILQENATGGQTTVYPGPSVLLGTFPVNFTAFPGRDVTMLVKLDDAMLGFNTTTSTVRFDRTIFEDENFDPVLGTMVGFISDHVSFDISAMPAAQRPRLQNSEAADMVMFTGDQIAISKGFGGIGTFNMLRPLLVEDGIVRQTTGGGTYTVIEPDPRDPNPISLPQLTSLEGAWRPYTAVLNNLQSFNMVVFPNSRGLNEYQAVAFNRNGSGQITAFWQGSLTLSGTASGTIEMWSLDQLVPATATNPANGTASSLIVQNGVVTGGQFTFTTPPAGFPFPTTGNFVVLRR
jgi:hypothetical protein